MIALPKYCTEHKKVWPADARQIKAFQECVRHTVDQSPTVSKFFLQELTLIQAMSRYFIFKFNFLFQQCAASFDTLLCVSLHVTAPRNSVAEKIAPSLVLVSLQTASPSMLDSAEELVLQDPHFLNFSHWSYVFLLSSLCNVVHMY